MLPLLVAVTGCGWLAPRRLTATWISTMPEINGVVETPLWSQAKPLTLKAKPLLMRQLDARPVQVRALYDGRMLAFLISWPDATETDVQRWWLWSDATHRYELEEQPVDQLTVLWPLPKDETPISTGTLPRLTGDDFDLLSPKPGRYDAWQWSAGWTNISRVAEDMVWTRKPVPPEEATAPSPVPRYPTRNRRGLVSWWLENDWGRPGTIPTPRPRGKTKQRLAGAMGQEAGGSVADVFAWGQYTRAQVERPKYWVVQHDQRTPGYWFESDPTLFRRGLYLVEIERPLVTADAVGDYQLRGNGPFEFALAITDQEMGREIFVTPRIKLWLGKAPATR